jgi:outer membrane lipoprotein SlyB
MQRMSRAAIFMAVLAFGGCATTNTGSTSTPGDTPVGTMGTRPNDPVQVDSSRRGVIPVGQELDVRLQTNLSSATATAEQRFEATTAVDLRQGESVLIPAGSTVRGIVSGVDPAGRVDRTGRLTLAFDRITVRGREYPMRAMATQVFESGGIRDEVGTVGTAGAVGAIVGGIIGGLRGALIGAAVGSGGVIAATEGKDVELSAGTILRIRLDSPLEVR